MMKGLLLLATVIWLPLAQAQAQWVSGMTPSAGNAVLPDALDNLSLGPVQAATMICTTTNTSTAVTACNSTAYLAVGMFVTGPGIAAGTTVVSGITATGFTMSAAAGAAAGTGLVSAREAFWSDIDSSTPQIMRLSGRLMVGNAIGTLASRAGTYFNFCPTAAYCANWAPRDSQLAVMSQNGTIAITGMSRSSMNIDVPVSASSIGVAGYSICDNGTAGRNCWASYLDVQLDAAADGRWAVGGESALKNKAGDYTSTPYDNQPGVFGHRYNIGGDSTYGGAGVNPINAVIEMVRVGAGNAGYANKGIVFGCNMLTGMALDCTTGTGTAIDMAKGHQLRWAWGAQTGAIIRSDVNNTDVDQHLIFGNDKTEFRGPGGVSNTFRIQHVAGTTPVNHLTAYDAATGFAARLAAEGTDTDIKLAFVPKGAGTIRFGSGAAPAHIETSQTTAPALTSCGGGSPAIVGTDTAGKVTMGTTATGCVITFNVAYAAEPHCVVTWRATPLASQSYAVSASAITLTQTSASGNVVNYICVGRSGG